MGESPTNQFPPPTANPPPGAQAVKPERLRQRRLLLAAVIVVAIAIVAFMVWRFLFKTVVVSLAPVGSNVAEQVFGLGVVGARIQSKVGFKVAGVLTELDADEGDRIGAGQTLAKLDARDIEAQVAVARANVAQARASIAKAKADAASAAADLSKLSRISARDTQLIKSGLVSTEQAQTDKAAVRVARAKLAVAHSERRQAQAAIQSARAQEAFEKATLANYALRAPYDGWVVSRDLEPGAAVTQGQPVFTLVKVGTVWTVGYVDERLAGRLHVGQPAQIVLRSEPGKRIPGRVARIEIQSDAINEERVVDVAFDHIPANIHLGEQAEVYITTGILKRAVLVPQTAITRFAHNKGTVWILDNGKLSQRLVAFGPQLLDGRFPVLSTLPDGAAVVLPKARLRIGGSARAATRKGIP